MHKCMSQNWVKRWLWSLPAPNTIQLMISKPVIFHSVQLKVLIIHNLFLHSGVSQGDLNLLPEFDMGLSFSKKKGERIRAMNWGINQMGGESISEFGRALVGQARWEMSHVTTDHTWTSGQRELIAPFSWILSWFQLVNVLATWFKRFMKRG